MSSMFWGLRLEPGKRYSTTVDKSFHVSMAALDCSSVKSDNEVLSVMIDEGESNVPFILCNLQKNKLMQSSLDLNFMSGERITIFCKGNGVIHLSGYIVPEEDDELEQLGEDDDDDDEGEEEEDADEIVGKKEEMLLTKGKKKVNGLQGKRKMDESKSPQTKRKKLVNLDEDTDDTDDEDDDMASDDNEDENMGLEGEESDDDDEDDDDDDDEDDDEDDSAEEEEESDEENMPSKTMQQAKKNKAQAQKQHQQQNATGNKQQNQQSTPGANKQQNQGKQQKTPNGLTSNVQTKKDKKKGDKTPGGTPNNNAKLNKSNDESGSPATKKGGDGSSPAKKILDGGVMIKEIKVGNGPVCKNGKAACVYYTGRFKQNNKVFDSTTEGSGFKFRVGKGEVIKGWDVGVVGMKVGGKRLITCPPHMAYGQKGSPPTIPANSTLVFEVELKSVN